MIPVGEPFRMGDAFPPAPGCTFSTRIVGNAFAYALAEGTDISPESYAYPRMFLAEMGDLALSVGDSRLTVPEGSCVVLPAGPDEGAEAEKDCVYTEIDIMEGSMNGAIKDGTVFELGDLVPYRDDTVANMDVVKADGMKFVVMAFDAGTGLNEHAAPGDAIVFALDGKGIIGYEGKEHELSKGQCFRFAKNGKHYVKAEQRFKMALFLIKD